MPLKGNGTDWKKRSFSMEENFGPPIHPHPREHAFQPCRGPVKGPPSPSRNCDPIENELKNILEEIKTITNKIRDEVNNFNLNWCFLYFEIPKDSGLERFFSIGCLWNNDAILFYWFRQTFPLFGAFSNWKVTTSQNNP